MKTNILTGKRNILSLLFITLIAMFLSSCGADKVSYTVQEISSGTDALIIGLQPLNDSIIWGSGTNATILKSDDQGESWKKFTYQEADSLQFRDIHPISDKEAVVLSSGEGKASQIFYFHEESGWQKTFQMTDEDGFLDAVQLWDNGQGLAYGDAIDSLAYILKTTDFGKSWMRIPTAPLAGKGEGGFASSGSNITLADNGQAWIGTGAGGNARVLYTADYGRSWTTYNTPMVKGDAAGITAIKYSGNKLWIAGGDLAISDQLLDNIYYSDDKGNNWNLLEGHQTKGSFYGMAVAKQQENDILIACGPNGAELYIAGQNEWGTMSDKNLWTTAFIDNHTALIAGKEGMLLKVVFD